MGRCYICRLLDLIKYLVTQHGLSRQDLLKVAVQFIAAGAGHGDLVDSVTSPTGGISGSDKSGKLIERKVCRDVRRSVIV